MVVVQALCLLLWLLPRALDSSCTASSNVLRVAAIFTEDEVARGSIKAFRVAAKLINEEGRSSMTATTAFSGATSVTTSKRFEPFLGHMEPNSNSRHAGSGYFAVPPPPTCLEIDEIVVPAKNSSFQLAKRLCKGMKSVGGYHAVIGPTQQGLSSHVRSICHALDIPHLKLGMEMRSRLSSELPMFTLEIHPRLEDLHTAFADLLTHANWSKAAILFERDEKAQRVLLLQDILLSRGIDTLIRQLRTGSDFRRDDRRIREAPVLRELKQKDYQVVLLDLDAANLAYFFKSCQEVGYYGEGRHFVLTHLNFGAQLMNRAASLESKVQVLPSQSDSLRVNLSYFHEAVLPHYKSFSFFRLMEDPEDPLIVHFREQLKSTDGGQRWHGQKEYAKKAKVWASPFARYKPTESDKDDVDSLELAAALAYDGLLALTRTVSLLHDAPAWRESLNLSCEQERPWNYGTTFFNYVNTGNVRGITGTFSFQNGRRSSVKLTLLRYSSKDDQVRKVGRWSSTEAEDAVTSADGSTSGGLTVIDDSWLEDNDTDFITLTVVTKEEKPYVMLKPGKSGNDAFDGFAIDLLKAISDVIGFKFRLYTVPDNLYGFYNHDLNEWNGIVRQLMDKRADLAVASMTINYARETVIDFTKPFMNLGISILFKAPKDPATELFSFMNPLALEIWLYILLAYILVSLTIWIVARFSPYEWAFPHPCVDSGLVFQNDFTLPNSFWFAIGTLMQQGSDLNPKATSTRLVGGIWWFFTLIIISSYTANLAAFLTVERMATPIESAEDLADQNDIAYGTLVGGSTMTFFRDSKIETYQKMWRYMESNEPETFVSSYENGVDRVLNGNYAFLCESTMLDYLIQRNCNLTQIGGLLDNKGYGIATPKGSKWRDRISQEKGVIQMYYDKWWKNHGHHKESACDTKKTMDQKAMANALGVVNIGGIFVVLLCGLAFAVIVAIIEFCWSNHTGEQITSTTTTATADQSKPGTSLCCDLVHTLAPYLFGIPKEADGNSDSSADGARHHRPVAIIGRSDCSSCTLVRDNTTL